MFACVYIWHSLYISPLRPFCAPSPFRPSFYPTTPSVLSPAVPTFASPLRLSLSLLACVCLILAVVLSLCITPTSLSAFLLLRACAFYFSL